jgi:hypothetical protein
VLWGDGQAANPANALLAQIGQLRRTLGPAAILTPEPAYHRASPPVDVSLYALRIPRAVPAARRHELNEHPIPSS